MLTASYLTDLYHIRNEYKDWTNSYLGALDAPDTLAAGSHESVKAITISDYWYHLPTIVTREDYFNV